MVSFETIAAIVFLLVLTFFLSAKNNKLETKKAMSNFFFSMYRTRLGINLMDSMANKWRKITFTVLFLAALSVFFLMFYFIGGLVFAYFLEGNVLVYALIIAFIGLLVPIFLVIRYGFYNGVLASITASGFMGMILIVFSLVSGLFSVFLKPESPPPVGIVLPIETSVPGIFGIPFTYWIMSIFVIAFVHEFSHGLIARAHKIKVKSSGFAFAGVSLRIISILIIFFSIFSIMSNSDFNFLNLWLTIGLVLLAISYIRNLLVPLIPAAFVEPDEKELKKRHYFQQLSVFAAGPFSNIVFAFIFLAIASLIFSPLALKLIEPNGIIVKEFTRGPNEEKFPLEMSGMNQGEVIKQIDNVQIVYSTNLSQALKSKKPGQTVNVKTDQSSYKIKLAENPENKSSAYMGAYLEQSTSFKESGKAYFTKSILWIGGNPYSLNYIERAGLIGFLIILNLGIGLFNLIPFGPFDGGRMFQVVIYKYFRKENAERYLQKIGTVFLFILLVYIFVIFKNIALYFLGI